MITAGIDIGYVGLKLASYDEVWGGYKYYLLGFGLACAVYN